MIHFNESDGSITIDFPDLGPIRVAPPKYGAFKRIRHERARFAEKMQAAMAAKPTLDPIPDDADQSPEAAAERQRLTPIYQDRLLENQDLVADTLAAVWRFILIGDDTFKGLADPQPPTDADEWPAELLIDAGEFEQIDGQATRMNTPLLDAVLTHWGKVRSVSGSTANA